MTDELRDRVAELHRVLVEQADPLERAHAHVELGQINLDEGKGTLAIRHYREALKLDPSMHTAREALRSLGDASVAAVSQGSERGRRTLRRVLERFNRAD